MQQSTLALEQLAQQAFGGFLVAPALQQHVQHDPVLVHRTPQPVLHTGDPHCNLIQVPFIACAGQPAADLIGKALAELEAPLPNSLVAHGNTAS